MCDCCLLCVCLDILVHGVQYDIFLHVQFRPNFHFVGVLKLLVLSFLVLGTQLFLKVRLIF